MPPLLRVFTCTIIFRNTTGQSRIVACSDVRSVCGTKFAYFKYTGALCDVQRFTLTASTCAAQESVGVTRTISRSFEPTDMPRRAAYALVHFDDGVWHEFRLNRAVQQQRASGVLMCRCRTSKPNAAKERGGNFVTVTNRAHDWKIIWELYPEQLLAADDREHPRGGV